MSQSTEKSLGQVLYEADHDPRIYLPYVELPAARRADYERMAQAVAAVVREQCAQVCEGWLIHGPMSREESSYDHAIEDCVGSIRSMKP